MIYVLRESGMTIIELKLELVKDEVLTVGEHCLFCVDLCLFCRHDQSVLRLPIIIIITKCIHRASPVRGVQWPAIHRAGTRVYILS